MFFKSAQVVFFSIGASGSGAFLRLVSQLIAGLYRIAIFIILLSHPLSHGNTAVQPASRDSARWAERHQAMVEEAARGGIDVFFLGDSITDGWRHDGRPHWDRYFAPLRAVNFGVDGDRTQSLLWRLENGLLDGPPPRVFVLLIGTNNISFDRTTGLQRNTPDEALAGIVRVVQTLRAKAPSGRVLLLGILPRGAADGLHRAQIAQINAALSALDDGDHVHFLDVGQSLHDENGAISIAIMPDLLHLSEAGYAVVAASIAPELNRLLDLSR